MRRPLGCNGKPGDSGRKAHARKNQPPCSKCKEASNHAKRERTRGQANPRKVHPCGTPAAARRHRYNDEPLDFACKVAEATYRAEQRKLATKKY